MKADLIAPVDCTSTLLPRDSSREDLVQSHQEHPAVLPRLTYSISDLWAGRITEAVRDSWDALLAVFDSHPAPEEPIPDIPPIPDIQRVIAQQVQVQSQPAALRAAGPPVQLEPAPIKKPNWGRIQARS